MKRRTQIYIDEELYQSLKKTAQRRQTSLSEVIRGQLWQLAEATRPKHDARKILLDLAELGKTLDWAGAPHDLSENIDHYLYGAPLKQISKRKSKAKSDTR